RLSLPTCGIPLYTELTGKQCPEPLVTIEAATYGPTELDLDGALWTLQPPVLDRGQVIAVLHGADTGVVTTTATSPQPGVLELVHPSLPRMVLSPAGKRACNAGPHG